MREFFLTIANQAQRDKNYLFAMSNYFKALHSMPALKNIIIPNIIRTKFAYHAERETKFKPRVAVCGCELHRNADRAYSLVRSYEMFADVEIIESYSSDGELKIWKQGIDEAKPNQDFLAEDNMSFIEKAIAFVAVSPYDIIHLSNPCAPNVFLGLLYKIIWTSKVFIDIDDENIASFSNLNIDITVCDYLKKHKALPALKYLKGEEWAHLAIGLAKEFDGVTVSSHILHKKYGGDIINNAQHDNCLSLQKLLTKTDCKSLSNSLLLLLQNIPYSLSQVLIDINSFCVESWQADKLHKLVNVNNVTSTSASGNIEQRSYKSKLSIAKIESDQCLSIRNIGAKSITHWLTQLDLNVSPDAINFMFGGMVIARLNKESDLSTLPKNILVCFDVFEILVDMPAYHKYGVKNNYSVQFINETISSFDSDFTFLCAFHNKSIVIESVWYASNRRDLFIRILNDTVNNNHAVVIRCYQYDAAVGGGLIMVGEHLIDSVRMIMLDLALHNPFMPILLILTTPDATLIDAILLPYPSLFAGGIHESERLAVVGGTQFNDVAKLTHSLLKEHLLARVLSVGWGLGGVTIDVKEATGGEVIFSSDFKEWLWIVFSLRLTAMKLPDDPELSAYWQSILIAPTITQSAEKFASQSVRNKAGTTLLCSPQSIPSLHALTASLANGGLARICHFGSYLLDQYDSGNVICRYKIETPKWICNPKRVIAFDGSILRPMILSEHNQSINGHSSLAPVAIVNNTFYINQSSQMIMPISPEINSPLANMPLKKLTQVNVIITAEDYTLDSLAVFLESLRLQCKVEVLSVVFAISSLSKLSSQTKKITDLFAYHFPKKYDIRTNLSHCHCQRIQKASTLCEMNGESTHILFINKAILLHDVRTLATLSTLLEQPNVATASCLVAQRSEPKFNADYCSYFSGIFSSYTPSVNNAKLTKYEGNTLFQKSVYPVASNSDALFMIKTNLWKKTGGFATIQSEDIDAVIEFSGKLADKGHVHLCTSRVCSELLDISLTCKQAQWTIPLNNPRALFDTSMVIEVISL